MGKNPESNEYMLKIYCITEEHILRPKIRGRWPVVEWHLENKKTLKTLLKDNIKEESTYETGAVYDFYKKSNLLREGFFDNIDEVDEYEKQGVRNMEDYDISNKLNDKEIIKELLNNIASATWISDKPTLKKFVNIWRNV